MPDTMLLLKILGLVAIVVALTNEGYQSAKARTVRVSASTRPLADGAGLLLSVRLHGIIASATLTEITLDRQTAEALQARCPDGFQELSESMIAEDKFALDYIADHPHEALEAPEVRKRIHAQYVAEVRDVQKHNKAFVSWHTCMRIARSQGADVVLPLKTSIPATMQIIVGYKYRMHSVQGCHDVMSSTSTVYQNKG